MAKQTINVGTNQDDGTGDLLRVALIKVNDNFTEIYNELGGTSLSSLSFNSNVIGTDTTNQDIVLSPSGAGEIDLSGDTLVRGSIVATGSARSDTLTVDANAVIGGAINVTGHATFGSITIGSTIASDLTVGGDVTVQGLFSANGSIDLGDSTADTVTVVGRFDSSLVPSVTLVNDIGGTSLRWRDVYARDIDARNATFSGDVTIGGNITIGDADTDSITIQSDLASNIIPDVDSTYNIGSDAKRYAEMYADTVDGTTITTGEISMTSSTITTTTSNQNLTIDPNGTGAVIISTLRVSDLAANQVVTAGTGGALQTDASLTWNGTVLEATQAKFDTITIAATTGTIATSSGNIVLSPSGDISADSNNIINVTDPSNLQDAATKNYVDQASLLQLNLAGGTMSGTIAMGNNRITGMNDPSAAQDAATKAYVDANAGGSFTIVDDSSTANTITNGEHLGIKGGDDITTVVSGDTLTITNASTLNTVLARGATTTTAATFNGGLFSNTLTIDDITINSSGITTNITNADIQLDPNGTGRVEVVSDRLLIKLKYTPSSSQGQAGDRQGDVAFDDNYVYFCKQDYDGATNIWTRAAMSTW
jgi:hypothetical protein